MSKTPTPYKSDQALLFRFQAIDEERAPQRGTIRAHSRDAAREQLLLRFAHLLTLEEVIESDWARNFFQHFRNHEALPVYVKGLAVMLDAGLPLAKIFEVSTFGEDKFLNEVMQDIGASIQQGRSLSLSVSRWPMVFDDSFIGMCRSAERSGRLHVTFRRLAELLERRWALKKKMKAALTYPVVISLVALAIFWILVAVVVPSLAPSFKDIGATLPWPTQVLLTISKLTSSLPMIMLLISLVIGFLVLFYRLVLRGQSFPTIQLYWDTFVLRLPLFGPLYQTAIFSRSLSTMAALIESGLPITEVLGVSGEVSGSPVFRRHFQRALVEIKEGCSIAEGLGITGGFPALVVGMTSLGEESGSLPFLLNKIADLYEEDFESKLQSLTVLVEPLLLGIMGLVIGFIVLGTFLPLINLVQQL